MTPWLKAYLGLVGFSLAGSLLSRLTGLNPGFIAPAAGLLTIVAGVGAVFAGSFAPETWKKTALLLGLVAQNFEGIVGSISRVETALCDLSGALFYRHGDAVHICWGEPQDVLVGQKTKLWVCRVGLHSVHGPGIDGGQGGLGADKRQSQSRGQHQVTVPLKEF